MALDSTLYRFKIQLSDVERGLYRDFEVRLAMHPSESIPYLFTRLIAYALNFQEGIEFSSGGIASTDDPAVCVKDLTGAIQLWIEVGNPSARRIHKAAKSAKRVRIYTYRDPIILRHEVKGESIHRAEEIEIFSLDAGILNRLGAALARDNAWSLLYDEGELSISAGAVHVQSVVGRHRL